MTTSLILYLLSVGAFAVVWSIIAWMAVNDKDDPDTITVGEVMVFTTLAFIPVINTIGFVFGLVGVLGEVQNIVLFGKKK